MNKFNLFGRSLLLVVTLLSLYSSSVQAQFCNFNAGNIDLEINNVCTGSDPYATINFNNFFLDGDVVIEYEPVYGGFFQITGVNFSAELEVVSGIGTFEIAEPRLPGFTNNFVRITSVSFNGLCTQDFIGNELVSNNYDYFQPSGLLINNEVTNDPPCPGIPTGTIEFQFSPATPNNTLAGFTDFNRFEVRQVPFTISAFTTVNPPNTGPNNTNNYMVNTQGLVSGTYTYLIYDRQEDCETTYDVTIGGAFDVELSADANAGCFEDEDGVVRISVIDGDPSINGPLTYGLQGPDGLTRTGVITGTVINNMLAYPDVFENNLPAGAYSVTLLAGSGGCTATDGAVLTEFDQIVATDLVTDPICGDETTYTLDFGGVIGVGANGQFRLRDATRFDAISGTSNCFDSPGGFQSLTSIANNDGTFTYSASIDPANCFDIEQDTTVAIFLELRNPTTNCREIFEFQLQINAQPEQPDAMTFAVTMADDTLVSPICSRQDFEVFVEDYDAAFEYEVFFAGGSAGANIDTLGAFAGGGPVMYTGSGSVVASFGNNNNGLRTIEFGVTKTNPTTGCVSETEFFEVEVRPEPVVTDPAMDEAVQICSDERFSIRPEINGSNNANLTFDYSWAVSADLDMTFGQMTGAGLASEDRVRAEFVNTSGVAQTATLTITPKYDQNSQLIGGGSVPNDCSGEIRTITVTVTPQPTLSYNLVIGDEAMTLSSGDVLSEEICSGDDFVLNGLSFAEANGIDQNMFVNYQVFGDARFLAIPAGASGLDLDDEQVNENVPINTFAIGLNNIQNNHPDNNAQVARIVLTPYFESDPASPTDFPSCAGDPIELFVTINPTAPTLASPQLATVCSDQRVEFTIGGASGVGNNLETRITEVNLFDASNDFVVPAGADRIEGFTFMIQGANGGSSAGARGGFGGQISGELDETELLPGDTVRVRKGDSGVDGTASGSGGDATTMVVIAGSARGNIAAGDEVFRFVAAGGGGAGLTNQGGDVTGLDLSGTIADGSQGQGPGGFGGTGYPDAMGGLATNNGGGGGGGYAGGNGGDSQSGSGGDAGTSFATTTLTAPATAQNDAEDESDARIMFTVVYDDIRFNLVSVDIPTDLSSVGEDIADNDGEVDTILFGQQFVNETNAPLDVTYVFGTTTEAQCNDGGQVTVILTVEPEPTGFLTSGETILTQTVDGNYTAELCSGDALDASLSSFTDPTSGSNFVYFEIDTEVSPNNGTVGFFGNASGTAHAQTVPYFLSQNPLAFVETGIFNNSGANATITYTITPFIDNGSTGDDCEGEPFTLTVTVFPGFPNGQIVTPGRITGCSRDVFGEDLGFDFEASQPNLNNPFVDVRLVDYVTNAPATGFTAISGVGVDTTGLGAGGILIGTDAFENDSYRNLTGGNVSVSYFVRLVSDDGCESAIIEYEFRVRPEPIIDDSETAFSVCEGDNIDLVVTPAANSASVNNFSPNNVTFDYFVEVPATLSYLGGNIYPLLDGDVDEAENDEYDNLTDEPQTVIYRIVPETNNGCVGDTVTFEVTVLPRPDIVATATQAANSVTATTLNAAPTITICSGTAVDFGLTQPVSGVGVATRIGRVASNNIVDGNGDPLDAFENNLPVADFSQTLVNNSNATESVRYVFRAYNFGADGIDDGGNGDDCLGAPVYLFVEVLPALTDPSTLTFNYFVDGSFDSNEPTTDTLCSMTSISIRPGTTVDPASGVGFVWNQTNDGGLATDSGFGEFSFLNGNTYFAVPADRIEADLENTTTSGVTFTYEVQLYTFGADGIDDQLAAGSDDCPGPVKTLTVYVEPEPALSASITVGSTTETISSRDEVYFYELCSGDDFSLGSLSFNTNDVPGRVKYVEFGINGASADEFLDIDDAGILSGNPFLNLDITGFQIGQNNVQNTSNDAYIALISLTPYYEDDTANPAIGNDCFGESIEIIVILNPEVTGVPTPQDLTVCSGEAVDYEIINGANTVNSFVSGSHDFANATDFVFPDNAAGIPLLSYSITSADGGNSTLNGQTGARGLQAEGFLSVFTGNVIPGDTLRSVFGQPGADGATAGSGGGGSALLVIGGPNRAPVDQGEELERIVLGGGGGAGTLESASTIPTLSLIAPSTDGTDGAGPGGEGGSGAPTFAGGAGFSNGGGGGGGWFGGNGGDSFSGSAGASGASIITNGVGLDNFGVKDMDDGPGSSISIDFILSYDDVIFSVTDKQVPMVAGFDASMAPVAIGDSGLDTLLNGEVFINDTDVPQTVSYTLSTGTEAACPGGEVVVNVTVEPNATLDLASNGTMIDGTAADGYTATICSGDSLSAILSSSTMPTVGNNAVRARVINVTSGPDITFNNTNTNNASGGNGTFGGVNRPAANDILFYEEEIVNTGTSAQTVEYTVVSFINVPGPDCQGDTITLTVTVQPGFDGVDPVPAQFGLCSNVSLADAGFDVDATQTVQIPYDIIVIENVTNDLPAPDANFETISSVFSGTPVETFRNTGFFGGETYRNRTGGPVVVTYQVRLRSADGCDSEVITYNFRYTAEGVIDDVPSPTNQIDTVVCNTQAIGLEFSLAPNSAWFGGNTANVTYNIEQDLPAGLTQDAGASYPLMAGSATSIAADEFSNVTNAPITVTYTVTPVNNGCLGEPVDFTATILPNPQAELTLMSLDSVASFSLENSAINVNPNPVFGMCSGQALDVMVTDESSADIGVHMSTVRVTGLDALIPGAAATINYTARVEDLADSLSFAMGELVNTTANPISFTVRYRTFFNRNGQAGNQGVANGDCNSSNNVEFDVVVSPANIARVDVRVTDDAIVTPIPTGQDTLCSGDLFDLAVRTASLTANDPNLPAIDSFEVQVIAPAGMVAGGTAEGEDFVVEAPFENAAFYFTRLDDLTWNNTTPGIKTVTYIATPFSAGCAGIPDTTTISFRPDIVLALDVPAICVVDGADYPITAVDQNQASSTTNNDYDWRYLGGDADLFSISRGDGSGTVFINPTTNTPINFNNTQFLRIGTVDGTGEGSATFRISYRNDAGCTIVDTLTLTISDEVSAGVFDNNVPIQCEGSTPIILDDYLDNADPGGTWTQVGGPMVGTFNAAAGSFLAENLNAGGAVVSFEFRYLIGDGASGCTADSTDITVEVQSTISAGTYTGTPVEACDALPPVNLYDGLIGEEAGGTFVQLGGSDNVVVDGADGIFDQTGVTPGTYVYRYEVAGRNGCPGDDETVVVEVLSQADCSDPVPCDVIELSAGINVISFDVIPNDNSIEGIFGDIIDNRNLVRIVAVRPGVDGGNPQSFSYLDILDLYVGTITGGVLPGYGYIVQVQSDATIEVCGVAADPDQRVALQQGINIVGYVPQGPEAVDSYFDDIIATNDLDLVRTAVGGLISERLYNIFPFPIGPLTTMTNGNGYVINTGAAFADGSWRESGRIYNTAIFDQFYGQVVDGDMLVGETIQFTDEDGNVYGETVIEEGGIYFNAFAFGDMKVSETLQEGYLPNAEVFVSFRGEQFATGVNFKGAWDNRRLDLDFGSFTSSETETESLSTSINVYPNPTIGMTQLEINSDRAEARVQVEVINGLGQVVLLRNLENLVAGTQTVDVDFTQLPAGAYHLRVFTSERLLGYSQVVRR